MRKMSADDWSAFLKVVNIKEKRPEVDAFYNLIKTDKLKTL